MNSLTVVFVVFLCLTLSILTEAAGKRTASVQDQIHYLLDEEKSLRESLQAKVQRLHVEAINLNSTIAPCRCSGLSTTPPPGRQIAYTGTLPSTMTSLTGNTVFNFSSDLSNVGQAFDVTSGHFVVPVSGLYGFSLSLFMNPRYWVAMRLVKNGNQILGVKTGHYYSSSSNNRQVNMATNYVIGNFTVGEEIWPQYVTSSGSRLDGSGVTTFSGILLHEF